MRLLGCAAHHPGDLGTRDVGHLGLVLVEAAGLQGVGVGHPGGVHVDDDHIVTAGGFVDLDDVGGLRSVEPGYLYRTHPTI